MACQTVADLVPISLIGAKPIEELLKKIPQYQVTGIKNWKGMQVIQATLWLSNPTNLATILKAIEYIKDFKNLGDLSKIMFLSNLLQYMGISGFIDFSKLDTEAMQKVTDALGCITKNIDVLQTLESSLMETVHSILNTSNIYQMLGVSDVMNDLGITDSYLFSELNSTLNNTMGISQLSNIPGINGTIPLPDSITQALTTTYVINGLAQTIGYMSLAQNNPQAQGVLAAAGQLANQVDPKTSNISSSRIFPQNPIETFTAITNGINIIEAMSIQTPSQISFQNALSQTTPTDVSNVQNSQEAKDATLSKPEGC